MASELSGTTALVTGATRGIGRATAIASVIVHLATDSGGFMHGAVVPVDGGRTAV
ncbi:hypothetical protein [Streptomyces sp. NPDC055134]